MNHYATPPAHALGDEARLKRIVDEFRAGYDLLQSLGKAVTYFGSHLTQEGDPIYEEARKLARMMAKDGFATVTGGGPGIMEAVNRGAAEARGRSIGFTLVLEAEQKNEYVLEEVNFYYLFVRKVILASAGHAYVFFPGGFGTLDEFFEISTLIHTHKLHEDVPVILVGRDYWDPMVEWLRKVAIGRFNAFSEIDLSMWKVVSDAEEAYQELQASALPVRLYY